jgi:multiple sugar transport system substrate-binding protein
MLWCNLDGIHHLFWEISVSIRHSSSPRCAGPALLALALALLAGCAREADGDADGAPKAAPQRTITALIWAPDWPEEMQRIAAEFSRENPSIRVDLQFMIGNSVEANLKPKVAANKLPDLVSINPNDYAAALAEQGVLAELGQTAAWNNMLDSLKGDWTSASQRHYGIAGGVAATLMYYNKDMFARAGVKAAPANFDEFLRVCTQLRKAGFTPIVWNGGFPNMLGNGAFSYGFANNVIAKTPHWKRQLRDGSLDLAGADGADIFAKIGQVAERGGGAGIMNGTDDEAIRQFTEGKTAMALHGSWAAGRLLSGKGFQAGVFTPPWNAPGRQVVPVIGSETGFAVSAGANQAAAVKFLEFLFGRGYPIQQNKRHNIAPLKQVQGRVLGDPQMRAYVDAAGAYPLTASPYYSFLPAGTIDMLHPLLQDVLYGRVSPQQAALRLDQSLKREAGNNRP